MMIKSYIFLALVAALAAGCAGPQKKDMAMEELNARISGLSASLEDSRSRFDELNAKFYLLQQKLEAASEAPAPGQEIAEEEITVPEAPPEGLRVVSLTEQVAPAQVKKPELDGAKSSLNKKAQTPEEMYERGQMLFSSGRYALSRAAFMEIADSHPGHELADNAIYWAGEAYYSEKDFTNALLRFREVAYRYPERNKAPDALLKAGYSYLELNETAMGRESLAELIGKYPASEAALKARQALAGL